jgi:hypothetical protein
MPYFCSTTNLFYGSTVTLTTTPNPPTSPWQHATAGIRTIQAIGRNQGMKMVMIST